MLLARVAAGLLLASTGISIAARPQQSGSPDYRAASPEHGGIVFTGSSIFRFWTHLSDQMAPLPVFNRAIAGTVTEDMLNRIGQLVLPYQPRIVVYYCGSNDISAGEDAAPIVERTKRFIQILHESLGGHPNAAIRGHQESGQRKGSVESELSPAKHI